MSKMGKKSDLESLHLLNHSKCMLAAFQNFRMDETMLDVTLICNGLKLKAHKLILSACSPLFKEMINENPCAHPIILFRNFDFCDLKAVIDFVYKGELSVPRERLMSALKVAEELHIRGLRRSEPNREKYEKLYNQVCGKLSGKKKRKRLHRNSSDSENELYNISDSDQSAGSGASLNAKDRMSLSETQQMDVESTDMEKDSANDKDIRPVVLRVGDHTSSNEESNSKNVFEYEENSVVNPVEQSSSDIDSQKEHAVSLNEETEGQTYESTTENIATSSHQDSFISCSDNANTPLTVDPEAEESKIKEEPTSESFEGSPKEMKSISSSSPITIKAQQQNDENQKLPDEGKRFICSKCDSVFTSRINFMKHKATGHSTSAEKKYPYKCQQCTFTSEDFDSLKNHLLTHLRSEVPFKCHVCAEEFSSEEMYRQHESMHESQKISLPDISSSSVEDIFSPQNKIPEKIVEFRCSICFARFTSKLRCQLHEKTCEGAS